MGLRLVNEDSIAYLNDELCQRICDDLQELRVASVMNIAETTDHGRGQIVQVASGGLYRQQNQHRQPVEHVVNCNQMLLLDSYRKI